MYCKFCGKEIEDNSKFCPECGKNLNDDIKPIEEPKQKPIQTQEAQKESGFPTALKVFFVLIIVTAIIALTLGLVLGLSDCNSTKSSSSSSNKNSSSLTNNDDNKLLSRKANLNDLNIVWQESSLSFSGTVIPKNDIENLIITFQFYDSNKQTIKTVEKRFGNISKDTTYDFTVAVSEIGYTNLIKIDGVRYNVTGGQVKYFG